MNTTAMRSPVRPSVGRYLKRRKPVFDKYLSQAAKEKLLSRGSTGSRGSFMPSNR